MLDTSAPPSPPVPGPGFRITEPANPTNTGRITLHQSATVTAFRDLTAGVVLSSSAGAGTVRAAARTADMRTRKGCTSHVAGIPNPHACRSAVPRARPGEPDVSARYLGHPAVTLTILDGEEAPTGAGSLSHLTDGGLRTGRER